MIFVLFNGFCHNLLVWALVEPQNSKKYRLNLKIKKYIAMYEIFSKRDYIFIMYMEHITYEYVRNTFMISSFRSSYTTFLFVDNFKSILREG